MIKFALAAALVAAAPLGVFAKDGGDKTVYGDDDRVDLYQVKDPNILKLADSTVALFFGSEITIEGNTATLATRPYGPDNNLCPEEPFYNQRTGAFCSGSLVAPDVIMTAGHCVTDQDDCASKRFVFGFGIRKEGVAPEQVPASEVYACSKLIGRQREDNGADWALIKLDRPVVGHAPLGLSQTPVAKDTKLCLIGHPSGLPTKVACGETKVLNPSPDGFFVANTDSYHGNSGSAVFNQQTGLIEGILVRGENDFEPKGDCMVSKVCPADGTGCRGEDVTKISAVIPNLPQSDELVAGHGMPAPDRVAPVGQALSSLLEKASAEFSGLR